MRKTPAAGWLMRGAGVCVLCAWGWARAAEPALTENEFLGEMPIVLSVSRLNQPVQDAPSAVTVIDREMIRASGARDLVEVLRLVPGFYVGHYIGNEPIVSHGITGRVYGRIQVLVDGRSVYTPLFGQVPWSSLPLQLDDVERIEVTRGPNAASYGANSFFAVINVITRHAGEDRGGFLLARAGTHGVADAAMRYVGQADRLEYRVTAAHQADDGFPDIHDFRRINHVSARGDYRLNTSDTLQIQFGYADGRQGQGWPFQPLNPPHTQFVTNAFWQAKWQRVRGADDELWLQFYYTLSRSHESASTQSFVPEGTSILVLPTVLSLDTDAERYDLEFQRIQSVGRGLRMAWGASARLDRVRAPLYLGTDASKESALYRAFAHGEWQVHPEVFLNGGAMVEHNDGTGNAVSPRASLNWHVTQHHTLRVGYSQAERTPTMLERHGHYELPLPLQWGSSVVSVALPMVYGSDDLRAERVASREVAWLGNWPALGFRAELRAYREDMRDLVAAITRQTTIYGTPIDYKTYANSEDAVIRGLESQLGWSTGRAGLMFSHAYRKVTSNAAANVAATPGHLYAMLGFYRLTTAWTVSAAFYHVDAMTPLSDGDPLQGYDRLDLRLAKHFKLRSSTGEVELVAQNVMGPYQDFARINTVERRYYATVRFGF